MQKKLNPNLLRVVLIAFAGFWIYAPALRGGWLMDDDLYITQNTLLHDPQRLFKIWFEPGALIEYYPIEATVQAAQWHWWQFDTFGFHLTNLLLHILSGLLFWRLLSRFDLRLAWLGGFLFVVHPVNVESVAWISELKNTLSLPPFLLAMTAWIDFENHRRRRDFFITLGCFLIAMLCKISMALFPAVILLYAWWKRGRIDKADILRALPFAAISLVLGFTTLWAGHVFRLDHLQPTDPPDIGGWGVRLLLPGLLLAFYFSKAVLPFHLMPVYPRWTVDPSSLWEWLYWPALVAGLAGLWWQRSGWARHALLGIGFFIINLLPFIGFTPVSYMSFTWAWDHLLYVPLLGLIGLAIAGAEVGLNRLNHLREGSRPIGIVALACLLALLTLESHQYAGVFFGPEKLWRYTIQYNPTSWLAHNNLASALLIANRVPEAVDEYREALRLNPDSVEANTNLGYALEQLPSDSAAHEEEAVAHFRTALKGNPHFYLGLLHLGDALAKEGHTTEAVAAFQDALRVQPNDPDVMARLKSLASAPPAPSTGE